VPPTVPAPVRPIVLTDVTVVDTRDGSRTPHQDVHLAGGRIAAIGAPGPAPDGAEVVAGAGRHVVPGYVDMHAHPLDSPDPGPALELMLAHGITGFRQMAGTAELLRRRREGTLGLPERSPALLAMPGEVLLPRNAATAGAAVATISRQAADGADFIKAGRVTPEVLAAAQRQAARLALPLVGHLPAGVDVREASRAGLRCVEHLGPGVGILSACSTDEAQVRAAALAPPAVRVASIRLPFLDRLAARLVARSMADPRPWARSAEIANLRRAVTTFTEGRARELARQFAADGTWQCPTLIRLRTQQMRDSADFRDDPDLRYVSARTTAAWERAARAFSRSSVRDHLTFAAAYRRQLELVRIFDEEGVALLAGSDCVGAAWVIAGPSLHREFDELGSAGLSPLTVLQAATLNPARFLGREAEHGTVEPGRAADLVLLDADPTADVQNLHRVGGVVRAGRHYSAADLDAMKAAIAAGPGVG
jgi:imidazolonepropionase-like amidohydrolase